MKTTELQSTTDAMVWAEEFVRIITDPELDVDPTDVGFMVGWFANAIETGRGADRDIFVLAREERVRAHAKHGDTSMESAPADDPTGRRFRILAEEVGEVAQEFNDAEHEHRPVDLQKLRKELIQVAAMAGAWADVCGEG